MALRHFFYSVFTNCSIEVDLTFFSLTIMRKKYILKLIGFRYRLLKMRESYVILVNRSTVLKPCFFLILHGIEIENFRLLIR